MQRREEESLPSSGTPVPGHTGRRTGRVSKGGPAWLVGALVLAGLIWAAIWLGASEIFGRGG